MRNRWSEWSRNVVDAFKDLSAAEIKIKLKENSLPFSVCFENWVGDFNLSSGIRNANSFGARDIFYVGKKRFDRRGAVGVQNYSDITHISAFEELEKLKMNYTFVSIENNTKSTSLFDFDWKTEKQPLICFGEEGTGITNNLLNISDFVLEIPSRGSVRSINCAAASAVAFYDFSLKYKGKL